MSSSAKSSKKELQRVTVDLVTYLVLMFLLVLLLKSGCLSTDALWDEPPRETQLPAVINSQDLISGIRGVATLCTGVVETSIFLSRELQLSRPLLPDGHLKVWCWLPGAVRSGVDLSDVSEEDLVLSVKGGMSSARVTLPPPQVLSVILNQEDAEWDHAHNWPYIWEPDREALLMRGELLGLAPIEMERGAVASGLLEETRSNTALVVTRVLMALGVDQVEVVFPGDSAGISSSMERGLRWF